MPVAGVYALQEYTFSVEGRKGMMSGQETEGTVILAAPRLITPLAGELLPLRRKSYGKGKVVEEG